MIITNLFENTESGSGYYHEQVAEKLPAGLQSDDDILDAAWEIVVKDLGRTVARNKFMDDDFESDLIGSYHHAHKQGVAEGSPQSMGTALTNALSKVEPGSKLDKKIRHHNDMVRRFGPEAGTMTSAPDGYRIDKKGFIRLGQGVAEGGYPEVDHMPGAVNRNPDRTTDVVKTNDKARWDRAVDSINAKVFDDMSDFTTDSKGETVTGNSAVWAKWDNATQTGWFNAKGRPLKPWPVTEQGVAEGEVYDLEKEYGYEKPTSQPKRASVPPTRPRLHPEDTDFMDPVERRLRADQERVKAAWAAHNAKKDTNESRMSELDAEYQDYKKLSPREFFNMYRITKQQWFAKYKSMLPQQNVQENKKKVNESVFLKEDQERLHEQWSRVGQHLVEYKLTPAQIQDLFGRVEQAAIAAGGNRTLAGRGVDKAAELNAAWEGLKDQIQKSHPVKGFDNLYDTAAAKLKTATGGDEGVMQYVNKYRAFAKEHPYIQSAVYAALIAAAGLSGAGLGGAGALGLLKMTDRLLQGDKASSALYKGAKTGALAMAAHSIADYFKTPNAQIPPGTPAKLPDGSEYVVQKGDTLSQIAQRNGVSVKDLMAANNGATTTTDLTTQGWNNSYYDAFNNQNAMGDYTGPRPHDYATTTNPKLTNPDVLQPGQKINVPGSLGPTQTYADNVGTAADTWDKVKGGQYTPSEISRNQAAKWNLPGAGEYTPPGGKIPASQAPMFDPTGGAAQNPAFDDGASQLQSNADFVKVSADAPRGASMSPDYLKQIISGTHPRPIISPDQAQAALDWQAQNGGQAVNAATNAASGGGQGFSKEYLQSVINGTQSRPLISPEQAQKMLDASKLKESQIYAMFDAVVAGQKKLNEGMWDSVKGAAARAGQWAQTKGRNITTKVTLDKLLQAWEKQKRPSDSELIRQILVDAGVSPQIINSVYSSMGIPATAPAQQTSTPGRIEPTMTATPAAAAPAQQTTATTAPPASVKTQAPANTSAWNYADAAKTAGVSQPAQKPRAQSAKAALPAWADPTSGEYVGRREVARRMAAKPTQPAKPATKALNWTAGTGAYSTQAAKQQTATTPVATPTKPSIAATRLTPAQYIEKIGTDELPESKMSELDAEYQDYKKLSPREFFNMYRITKQAWLAKYKSMLPQQPTDEGQRWPDSSNSIADRKAVVPNLAAYRAGETGGTKAGRPGGMTVATRVDPTITPTSVKRLGSEKPIPSFLQKGVAEADKKEDDLEPQVRDVVLQRAITRAKSDFPTAGSGLEALAKDFMRGQDQDQKAFDQLRQAERKQDQMLGQIAKIDQEQEQEIQDIENQNSTLASRLQQLQNVNGELEKKLAAMSGRREKRKADNEKTKAASKPTATKINVKAPADDTAPAKSEPKAKAAKAPNVSYTIKPARTNKKPKLTTIDAPEPGADAFSKMTPALAAAGNPQQSLFTSDYGKDSADLAIQQIKKNALASKNASAQDVPYRDVQDTDSLRKIAQQELGVQENNDQEAEYSNKYQDMVKRMGQKAREQEKSKPVDIKDLARRLAAIEASRKD